MNEELKVIISAEISKLKAATAEAKQDIEKLDKETQTRGEKMKKVFSSIGDACKKGFKAVSTAVGAVTTGMIAVGAAMGKNISQTAEYGDNIDKMSQKMGVSAESYQKWDFVMQHCGTSMDTMKASMKTLSTAAENGNDAFQKLGISQKDIANMSQEQLFDATIAGLQNVTDTTERTYLAGQLLGRGATELGAVLNMSAEETEAMKNQLGEMGALMSNEAVKNAATFQDSLQNVKTAITGAKNTIFSEFLPACSAAMDGVTLIFSGDIDGGLQKIKEGITGFIDKTTSVMPKVIQIGGSIVNTLLTAIVSNLPQLLRCGVDLVSQIATGIVSNISGLIKGVTTLFNEVVKALPQLIQVVVGALPSLIPELVSGVTSMIVTLCNSFDQIITPIIDALPTIITSVVTALIENLPALIQGVIQLVIGIVNSVDQIIATLVPMIPTIFIQLVVAIVKEIPTILGGVIQVVTGIAKCVADWYKGWFKGVGNALKKIVDKIKDTLKSIVDSVKEKFESIKTAISEKVEAAKTAVTEKFQAIKDKITEKVENAKTAVKTKFDEIKSGITEKVEAAKTSVATKFEEIKTKITQPIETAKTKVKGIIDTIKGFFNFTAPIPKIKLPHFAISPSGWKLKDLLEGSIPKLGISWYAKGGVFDQPTLFKYGGNVGGLGENGAEAVVPLEKNTKWLDKIAAKLGANNSRPVYLMVNGKVFAETTIDALNEYTKQTGNLPLKIC